MPCEKKEGMFFDMFGIGDKRNVHELLDHCMNFNPEDTKPHRKLDLSKTIGGTL